MKWFKRLISRIFPRKTEIKFCYRNRAAANAVFNALTDFFIGRRNRYKIVKSKIYDCAPSCSTEFEWCVYFKIIELDTGGNGNSIDSELTSEELEKIRKNALQGRT